MIFGKILEWDTLSIQNAICDNLKDWNVVTSLGFNDSGKSAFIITARKDRFVLLVYLENEEKQIRIKSGIDGKYLPKGKQIPKFSKIFKSSQLREASNYFEQILEEYK